VARGALGLRSYLEKKRLPTTVGQRVTMPVWTAARQSDPTGRTGAVNAAMTAGGIRAKHRRVRVIEIADRSAACSGICNERALSSIVFQLARSRIPQNLIARSAICRRACVASLPPHHTPKVSWGKGKEKSAIRTGVQFCCASRERTSRHPLTLLRRSGLLLYRQAARASRGLCFHEPPRSTRLPVESRFSLPSSAL